MNKSPKVLTVLFPCLIALVSTAHPGGAVLVGSSDSTPPKTFWQQEGVRMATVPVIFFAASAATWGERKEIRELRNRYIPTFRHHYDDYMQYVPAVSVFALNAAGIKGKHTVKRTFVSYAFSATIMGILVNSIKYTAKVERPSGDERNSFPSGHTSNSFMNATFLQKEYGEYRHPLYGVAGYTLASATAIGRQLNNRHWISDVLAGAGIGILSTELGYLVADRIYKDKHLNRPLRFEPFPVDKKPSFLEIRLGMSIPLSKDLNGPNEEIRAKLGFNMGLEGAWFFTKNFGIGGEYAFTSFPMNSKNLLQDPGLDSIATGVYTQPMGVRYLQVGPFFSLPLTHNWFVTGKATAGVASGAEGDIIMTLRDELVDVFNRQDLPFVKYKPHNAFSWSVGAGLQKRIARNLAVKYYTSYFHSIHRFDVEGIDDIDDDGNVSYKLEGTSKDRFHHLAMGFALTAFLW